MSVTTVGEELKHNPRLTKSKEEFVQIMKNLGLAKPKKMGKFGWPVFYHISIFYPVRVMFCLAN